MKRVLLFLVVPLLLLGCVKNGANPPNLPGDSTSQPNALKHFQSWDEVDDFVSSAQAGGFGYGGYYSDFALGAPMMAMAKSNSIAAPALNAESGGSADYSATNVQVEGVDEADIAKNDGEYLYVVKKQTYYSEVQKNPGISIVKAYPPSQAEVVSTIDDIGTVQEIFVNGDMLVAFGTQQVEVTEPDEPAVTPPNPPSTASGGQQQMVARPGYYPYPRYLQQAYVKVFDISDRTSPVLEKTVSIEGGYAQSRMIGSRVYAVFDRNTNYYAYGYEKDSAPVEPNYYVDGKIRTPRPQDVAYIDFPDYSYQYAVFFTIDLDRIEAEPEKDIVLMGSSQNFYVSQKNAYLTYTAYDYSPQWDDIDLVLPPLPPEVSQELTAIDARNISDWRKDRLKLAVGQAWLANQSDETQNDIRTRISAIGVVGGVVMPRPVRNERTVIHKFSLGSNVKYEGSGEVGGHVLNQFSMDESGDFFRIATTSGELGGFGSNSKSVENGIYVLDESLEVVGKLEGLAPGEKIYSARFMGDRAYLVTFKKVDPLFVIDLKDPANPKVLGKLKIPGYSDYLHPYDENYLIGLGKDAVPAENGDFAWYQGGKLSLFDVRDVANPKEVASYKIGDRGTESEALHDHKAFLFSREKNLLFIPITLAEIKNRDGTGESPQAGIRAIPAGGNMPQYGEFTFQGAYVFSIDPERGFALRGRVSHGSQEDLMKSGYYYGGPAVHRSAYIGDTLYTISDSFVMANDLATLNEQAVVSLEN